MARIAGIILPQNKRIVIALTYLQGIGNTRARKICEAVGISEDVRAKDLTPDQEKAIRAFIEANYRVEGEYRRERSAHIKRLKEIKSYRGLRHAKKLPVRGQRTKSNSRTVRGNARHTMGSGRRKLEKT